MICLAQLGVIFSLRKSYIAPDDRSDILFAFVVSYFNKEKLIYMVDKPVYYSTLARDGRSREKIAKILADRCNELGRMTFDEEAKEEQKEEIKSLEEKHA